LPKILVIALNIPTFGSF